MEISLIVTVWRSANGEVWRRLLRFHGIFIKEVIDLKKNFYSSLFKILILLICSVIMPYERKEFPYPLRVGADVKSCQNLQ